MEIKDATTTSLADDLKELNLDRPVTKQALKSTEELEQLTVDEQLTDIERAVYLLSSGQEVQRISVITNLPDLLRDSHADCMRRVVPKVREVLHVAHEEMQLAASSAFLQILRKDLIPVQNYAQTFLQTILSSIDIKDPDYSPYVGNDIANAWLETLLDVIDLLPKEVIKKDILQIAIEKGQLSQPVPTRLSCCKILGKIATRIEPFVIKKEILPVVQSLCQDVEYEVRGCMGLQLDPVARGLGLEATKSAILPELVELTNDEESYVRIAGLETVVNILTLVDEDTCRGTLIPLVCKFCQQALKAEDITLPIVAKQIGRLIHGFSAYLTDEQKLWFVNFFKQMCKVGLSEKSRPSNDKEVEKDASSKDEVPQLPDVVELEDRQLECRKNCAFNFPAIVMFIGAKSFKELLSQTFSSLCKDPVVAVRKSLSNGFHEVAHVLGPHVCNLLADLVVLLKDDSTEVLKGIMKYLPETLTSICGPLNAHAMHEVKQSQISDIIPAILSAEIVIAASNDWRLQEEIITHFVCFQHLTNSETIYNKIIPVLLIKLKKARALPVRLAAARSLLYLTRNLKKLEQRNELYSTLVQEYCHGRSCHSRSLFIDVCKISMEYYSKAFFKEYFYQFLIELHLDPIPNIRYRLCSVLPDLKRLIKLPSDRTLLQQLDACVRRLLIGEKDRDVTMAIKAAVEELDKIPIQMESLTRRILMEEDFEDKRKEEEEKKLIEVEEREIEKEEAARAAKEAKKSGKEDKSKIPGPKKGKSSSSKRDAGSAGVKRTPSTTSPASSTTSITKDSAAVKSSGKNSGRSGASGVSTPTSAGASSRKTSTTSAPGAVAGRRNSVSNSPSSEKASSTKKNSNGTIPSTKSKKSK